MGEFVEELLPLYIDYGSNFQENYSVTIHGTPDGAEVRRLLHPFTKLTYNLSYEENFVNVIEDVLNFYHRMNGSYRGFRVKNLADFSTKGFRDEPTPFDMILLNRGLSDWTYQMVKYYGRTALEALLDNKTGRRTIYKPVENTTRVGLLETIIDFADTVGSLEFNPNQFYVDTTTGIVQMASTIGLGTSFPVIFVICGNPTTFILGVDPWSNSSVVTYWHSSYLPDNGGISNLVTVPYSGVITLPIDSTGLETSLNLPATSTLLVKKMIRGDMIEINGDVYTYQSDKAQGTFSLNVIPLNNQTVTIGSTVYTFKTALSVGPTIAYQVLIGGNFVASINNLYAAITGATGIGTTYSTGTVAHTTVDAGFTDAVSPCTISLIAKTGGTAGNSIATTTTSTGSFGAATLTGGVASLTLAAYEILVGATDADSRDNLIAAINLDAGIGTIYGTGTLISDWVIASPLSGNVMLITATAPNAGLYGNAFTVSSSIAMRDYGGGASTGIDPGWSGGGYMIGGYAGELYDSMVNGIQLDDKVWFGCQFDIPCRFDSIPQNTFSEYDTIQAAGITILELLKP